MNRLPLIKTEPGTFAGSKPLQGRRESPGSEFNTLLADKAAAAPQKTGLGPDEQTAAASTKPVTLPAGLGRQLADMKVFHTAAVSVQKQEASGADIENESEFLTLHFARPQECGELRSDCDNPDPGFARSQVIPEYPQTIPACPSAPAIPVEINSLPTDQPFNFAQYSSAEDRRPPLDALSLPVGVTQTKRADQTRARLIAIHDPDEISPNSILIGVASEEDMAPAGEVFPLGNLANCEPDHQADSWQSETREMISFDARDRLNISVAGPVPAGPQMIQLQDFETESLRSRHAIEPAASASKPEGVVLGELTLQIGSDPEMRPLSSLTSGGYEPSPLVSRMRNETRNVPESDEMDGRGSTAPTLSVASSQLSHRDEANGWAGELPGMTQVAINAELLPPKVQRLPVNSMSDLIAAPPPAGGAYGELADVARIRNRASSEPEAGLGYEANPPVLAPARPQFPSPEVSDIGASSTEMPPRMSSAKMADETASGVQEMQIDNPTPKLTEPNAAFQPASNSGAILASIKQIASELAEPQIFLSEAEEVRAEINGRMKSVRIKLRPESLGEVLVHVHSQQDKVRIEIRVQNDDAGRAMLPEMDSIASALSGLGLAIDQVTLNAPGGGITVVHSTADRGGGATSQSQSETFQERPAGENGSRHPERRKTELDEKIIGQSRGIYI